MIPFPVTDNKVVKECLRFSEEASLEVGQEYVITSFDLGVCMKAYPLVWNYPKRYENHIIMIGTFHLACSYLNMIGKKMECTGLSDVLCWRLVLSPQGISVVYFLAKAMLGQSTATKLWSNHWSGYCLNNSQRDVFRRYPTGIQRSSQWTREIPEQGKLNSCIS